MNFLRLNTFGDSINRAFEAFCNQLFEYWVRQHFAATISYFTTVNGAGGDGGIEAYAVMSNGDVVGVQTKWFPDSLGASQIKQIETSIRTAKTIRPQLKTYVICLPRDFQSLKIGRGLKVVSDTEESRINKLIDDIAISFPDLTLEFWNEERIRQELQKAGNEDIKRFWFERQELSMQTLTARFDLAKAGWLQERYVPSLHQYGTIHQLVNRSIYTESFRQQLVTGCTEIISLLELVLSQINAFQSVSGSSNSFFQDLSALNTYLTGQLQAFTDAVQLIRMGSDELQIPIFPEYPYQSLIDRLIEARVDNTVLNAKSQLVTTLEAIHQQSVDESLNELYELVKPHNVILLGRPGTGKTHGFAREVETRIRAGYPALLIQAKEVSPHSWAQILQQTLGGFATWSDAEILAGFEALAARTDQYRAQTAGLLSDLNHEPTRMLICVDGVDESSDVERWRNRIDEARDLIRKYPRLRFAFSCRSYPPSRPNPYNIHSDNINRLHELPVDGDYHVVELAALYLGEYGIKYDSTTWLIYLFENALSVKLFCEKHKDEDLSTISHQITLSTASLIHAKFTQIEYEFKNKLNVHWSEEDQVFINILQLVAELFSQQVSIDHENLCTGIFNRMNGLVTRDLASKLVSDLVNHGVLEKQEFPTSNPLKPVLINYRLTYQSYFDYFIAINAVSEILQANLKELPKSLLGTHRDLNILLTIATILLNDHDILIGEDGYWVTSVEAGVLFQLKYQTLATASDEILARYISLLCHDWQLSVTNRNFLLRTVILPNLRRPALRLGLDCIHVTLTGFSSTYERDRFWSGPGKFESDTSENVGDILEDYQLSKTDRYDGPPLILAWSLSSVNNIYREKARLELTKWAVPNIDEFIKLLDLLFFCGDPQIQEDLASIMLGIVSQPDRPDSKLEALAQWVYDNVFIDTQISQLNNAVVRLGARSVINRAYALNKCTEAVFTASMPPYSCSDALMPLDFSGENDPQSGRFPVVRDLAWYVINKAYDGFLDRTTSYLDSVFLLPYKTKYDLKHIGPYNWAIAAAIAFIKSLGWQNQGQAGMTEASHGSKSQHSTFEEKYTWLAVHEIMGYLADRLPYKSYHKYYKSLPDYSLMVDIPNPAPNASIDKPVLQNQWYLPVNLSPDISSLLGSTPANVKTWVNRKEVPAFGRWIHLTGLAFAEEQDTTGSWVSLYMYVQLRDPSHMGSTTLEIYSGLTDEGQFQILVDQFATMTDQSGLRSLLTHLESSFLTELDSGTYNSVISNLGVNPIDESSPTISIPHTTGPPILIHKTVANVTERAVDGEKHYKIPSKFLRLKLGIAEGSQTQFRDKQNELLAFSYAKGDDYREHQHFLATKREELDSVLSTDKLKPFWVAFQIQNSSTDLPRDDKTSHYQNCRLWLVWEQDGQMRHQLILDDVYLN